MPENKNNIDLLHEEEDKFCVLKAEIALEQFVQVKILQEIIKEETDPEQKQILEDFLKEEKEEYRKAKASLDECMLINGNPNSDKMVSSPKSNSGYLGTE